MTLALNDVLHLRGEGLVEQLPLGRACQGDDLFGIADGGGLAGERHQGVGIGLGQGGHLPYGGVFFQNDLAGHIGEDLHGHALPDLQCAADFLGDDHPAQVVNPADNSCGFHTIPPKNNAGQFPAGYLTGSICQRFHFYP